MIWKQFFLFLFFFISKVISVSQKSPFELFQQFQESVDNWVEGRGNSKESLTIALDSISQVIPWLLSQSQLPTGLDPLVSNYFLSFALL